MLLCFEGIAASVWFISVFCLPLLGQLFVLSQIWKLSHYVSGHWTDSFQSGFLSGSLASGALYTSLCLCSLMAILSCQCYTWSNVFFLGSTQVIESRFVMPESALDVFPVVPPQAILPTL